MTSVQDKTEIIGLLKNFSLQAKKVSGCMNFFQSIKAEMNFSENKEAKITMNGVNEESLTVVMVHIRNFYMKKSNLYFPKIAELILNEQDFSEVWDTAKQFLEVWNKLLDGTYQPIGLQMNANKLSSKQNLDVWLNEGYFHADNYKPGSLKGLDALRSSHVMETLSKISMVDLLQRLGGLIIAFEYQVVSKILDKEKLYAH